MKSIIIQFSNRVLVVVVVVEFVCVGGGGGGGGGGGYVAFVLRHLRSELKCFNDKTSSTAWERGGLSKAHSR